MQNSRSEVVDSTLNTAGLRHWQERLQAVNDRTVRRRWESAMLKLKQALDQEPRE